MTDAAKRARELLATGTAKPWIVKKIRAQGHDVYTVLDANGFWVADCGAASDDAALIAAAPDLLRELCEEVERLRDSDIGEALLDYDNAAIAKESLRPHLTVTRAALREAGEIGLDATTIWEDNDADIAARTRLHALAKLAEEP